MDPVLLHLGPLQIRYYGVLFALAFLIGYLILRKLAKEKKLDLDLIDDYFIYIFFGIVLGARLGEILFYEPGYYFSKPAEMLYIWHGGLSSHGAFIGGILATLLFCKIHKVRFYKIADLIVIPVALGSVFIRIGNFINGEIVGRITDVPWAVKFDGYEGLRHPSQIYEAVMNFSVFLILLGIRKLKDIPEGFVFWSFVFIYSFFRFFVEFFKDYQTWDRYMVLTAGQYFSIVLLLVSGYFFLTKYRKFLKTLF